MVILRPPFNNWAAAHCYLEEARRGKIVTFVDFYFPSLEWVGGGIANAVVSGCKGSSIKMAVRENETFSLFKGYMHLLQCQNVISCDF